MMIWESTLKKLTDKTALIAASKWTAKPVNLKLVNNQINCVYRFESEGKGYYLRLTHEKIRPLKDLLAAIDFQHHLFQHEAPVCEAILSNNGLCVEIVEQEQLSFLAHVCREVPGDIMHFEHHDKHPYHQWGRSLALLHQASQGYQPKTHHFNTWQDLWQETWGYAKQEGDNIQDLFHSIDTQVKTLEVTTENFGLTHADHRPGNVLYDGKQIHIIDFDEPVYHWYLSDIAKPFLDVCNKPQASWMPLYKWYIEGYRHVLAISDEELAAINHALQMKSLDIYLWCKYNWFEATAPGGKPREEWLKELRKMAFTPLFPLVNDKL